MSRNTRRSAGSASRPVTNTTRRGGRSDGVTRFAISPRIAAPDELVRRAGEGVSLRRTPERRVLDAASEGKILVGDAARAMRRQFDGHAAPRDREDGMVICRFGTV